MSYTPNEWATGDVITAEKLNNVEDGIVKAGSVYPVGMTVVLPEGSNEPTITLQKTFGEIKSAVEYGSVIILFGQDPENNEANVMYYIPDEIQMTTGGGGFIDVDGGRLTATADNKYPSNSSK